MTQAHEAMEMLFEDLGDVKIVGEHLGLSKSYIYKIKNRNVIINQELTKKLIRAAKATRLATNSLKVINESIMKG